MCNPLLAGALFFPLALCIVDFSILTCTTCRLLAESKSAKQAIREASTCFFPERQGRIEPNPVIAPN